MTSTSTSALENKNRVLMRTRRNRIAVSFRSNETVNDRLVFKRKRNKEREIVKISKIQHGTMREALLEFASDSTRGVKMFDSSVIFKYNAKLYNVRFIRYESSVEALKNVKLMLLIMRVISVSNIDERIRGIMCIMKVYMLNRHLLKNQIGLTAVVSRKMLEFSTDSKMSDENVETLTTYLRCVTDGHCSRIGEDEFCANSVSDGRLICDECSLLSSIPSNPIDVSKIIADYTGF